VSFNFRFPLFTFDEPPNVRKLGGLFSLFNPSGQPDYIQIEYLTAFLMAVEEINDKSDGIFDDILPNTQIVVSHHFNR